MKSKRKIILFIIIILYTFSLLFCIRKLIPIQIEKSVIVLGSLWIIWVCVNFFIVEYFVKKTCNTSVEKAWKKKNYFLALLGVSILLWGGTFGLSSLLLEDVLYSSAFFSFCTILLLLLAVFSHIRVIHISRITYAKQEVALNMKQIELNFVKSQINPHFLFNHLNNITASIVLDPDIALDYTYKLSEFLRFQLDISKKKLITISEEIFFIQCYLDIEKLRLGDRFNLDIQFNVYDQGIKVPPLLFYPLIEYALKKNQVNRNRSKIIVELNADTELIKMHISIPFTMNDTIPDEGLDTVEMIHKKLHLLFPKRSSLQIESDDKMTQMHMEIQL